MKRPTIPVALVVALALGGPIAQARAAVRYIAFGDSNTRGNDCLDPGQGFGPDFVFDEDGPGCDPGGTCAAQTQDDADNCGYAYRLEQDLAASVPGAEVVNAGSAGETTPEALARIGSRIAAGDDVLIVMEGTNDISQLLRGDADALTPAQIADNLGLLVDEATERGMDTMVASPIRRVCPEFPGTCSGFSDDPPLPDDPRPEAWPDEAQTAALEDEIRDLTTEKSRKPRPSPWFKIGKDQMSVDANYFQEDLRFGHLRSSGYSTLTTELRQTILDDPALGAPVPMSPIGDTDESGVFVWDDYPEQGDGATLWQLQIDGPLGGTFHDEFYEQFEICSAGTCSVDVGTLAPGNYSWKVRGKNLRGPSPYSADTAFTVTGGGPGATVLFYPLEELFEPDPSFEWRVVPDATQYTLEVDGAAEVVSSANCGAQCVKIRGQELALGGHTWRVRPENAGGLGPWTPLGSFEVVECPVGQLTLDANDTGTGPLFEACGIIFAGNGFTVLDGEHVIFHAGNGIELQNGFAIQQNGSFEAIADR